MVDIYIPVWMRGTPLEQVYRDAWIETGDAVLAREAVRTSPDYLDLFPGNARDDGSVRYDEDTYLSIRESYADSLLSVGVNPDLFTSKFGDLIAGSVSPAEFASRVDTVYERVIDAIPEVRQRMDTYYGTGMTPQAILASFLDPDIGTGILEKRISISEIGAEASTRGFDVTQDFANRLYEAGTDTASEAAQFFALGENLLPSLQVLASRHDDPDDDFTLEEFAAAEIFNNPAQRRRMRLLFAQERADFNTGTGTGVLFARTDEGALTGLAAR